MSEFKEWRIGNYRGPACIYLLIRRVPFSYTEDNGLVFVAPESFASRMKSDLEAAYSIP